MIQWEWFYIFTLQLFWLSIPHVGTNQPFLSKQSERDCVKSVTTRRITVKGCPLIAGRSIFNHLSVFSTDEPSRSTTRSIWSTPAPLRTSTWSKKCCHDNQLLSLQLVYVHRVCHQRELSVGFSLHCKILFCVPPTLGSSFLQYARHLTDFIHPSLFVCFHHPDGIDCLFLLSFSMI